MSTQINIGQKCECSIRVAWCVASKWKERNN